MRPELHLLEEIPQEPATALSRASHRIREARSLTELAALLADLAVTVFARRARFELYVSDGDAALEPTVHRAGQRGMASQRLLAAIRARLVASRTLLTEPHAFPAREMPGHRSVITAPVLGAAETLTGALILEAAPDEPDFAAIELAALEGIAAIASVPLQRIAALRPDRARAELDRAAARRLQRGLMTASLPPGIGVTACAEYLPAFDVGGDFYSVKYLGDGKVTALIGDVAGNGVSAALVMSRVVSHATLALGPGHSPSTVLRTLHSTVEGLQSEMFVTAACIQLDAPRRRLTVANAGHLPLVVRRSDGETLAWGAASGTPLGMLTCDCQDEELAVEPGDLVLLMTDGLFEALDYPTGTAGMTTLLELVREAPHSLDAVNARLRQEVDAARSRHVLDDATWVGVHLER